jgi:hypothetical protein
MFQAAAYSPSCFYALLAAAALSCLYIFISDVFKLLSVFVHKGFNL